MGKRKKVNYELITKDSQAGEVMYPLLSELVEAHHEHLLQARIALAWNTAWSPDVDGRLVLGKCKRASDLDRELSKYDFVIMILKPFWEDADVTDEQRRALLDHELMHANVAIDTNGEPKIDERGRIVYRTRKHDIEEFSAIVERHGVYKRDLEHFAMALQRTALDRKFKPCAKCTETPGFTRVQVDGASRLTRCSCYLDWLSKKQAWSNDGQVDAADVVRSLVTNPSPEALKSLKRAAGSVGSMEMTTVIGGREVGQRIEGNTVEAIDRPARH